MPYRDFRLPDGSIVRTRISDEATLEWYREREKLRSKGYPDRPPEIDTENLRTWVEHGPHTTEYTQGRVSAWPLAHYILEGPPPFPSIKIMIGWMEPGDMYYLRCKAESGSPLSMGENFFSGERFFAADKGDQLDAFVEENLVELNGIADIIRAMGGRYRWLVCPPSEIVDLEQKVEDAERDYDEEYGSSDDASKSGASPSTAHPATQASDAPGHDPDSHGQRPAQRAKGPLLH